MRNRCRVWLVMLLAVVMSAAGAAQAYAQAQEAERINNSALVLADAKGQ